MTLWWGLDLTHSPNPGRPTEIGKGCRSGWLQALKGPASQSLTMLSKPETPMPCTKASTQPLPQALLSDPETTPKSTTQTGPRPLGPAHTTPSDPPWAQSSRRDKTQTRAVRYTPGPGPHRRPWTRSRLGLRRPGHPQSHLPAGL